MIIKKLKKSLQNQIINLQNKTWFEKFIKKNTVKLKFLHEFKNCFFFLSGHNQLQFDENIFHKENASNHKRLSAS